MSVRHGGDRRSARAPESPLDRRKAGSIPRPTRLRGVPAAAVLGIVVLLAVVALAVGGLMIQSGDTATAVPSGQTTVQGNGGQWTDVTPDRLADMLTRKDFLLVNVKTPYFGEIAGTDLYIPYDELARRQAELPADRAAKLLVYCRSGVESARAVQTLLGLGYRNIWNLAGGMNAWTASGRGLVNLDRR